MKKSLVTLFVVVAVLAVLLIAGGIAYTVLTAEKESAYTYVEATVKEVETEPSDDAVTIKKVTVTYTGADGEEVTAVMEDFPEKFSVGSTFTARYSVDPLTLSAEKTDWFTPIFMLVLGVAYALGDAIAFFNRKKFGLYALSDGGGDVATEDDDWSLADNDEDEKTRFLNGSDSE